MLKLSAVLLLGACALTATNIVVNPNPTLVVQSVSDAVTGANMAGLRVSFTYLFPGNIPTTFNATWAATGASSGAAGALPGPVLSLSGDSSGNLSWVYGAQILSLLLSVTLDGSDAGVLFDRGAGADIVFGPLFQASTNDVTVTYSGAVSLNGAAPVNDLYSKMSIDFSKVAGGGLAPQGFSFTQDTDLGVLTPEPPALLLLLAGFALAGLRLTTFRDSAPS